MNWWVQIVKMINKHKGEIGLCLPVVVEASARGKGRVIGVLNLAP